MTLTSDYLRELRGALMGFACSVGLIGLFCLSVILFGSVE